MINFHYKNKIYTEEEIISRYVETCPICDLFFVKRKKNDKFCSINCLNIAKQRREKKFERLTLADIGKEQIRCKICNKKFYPKINQKYCSNKCREIKKNERYFFNNNHLNLKDIKDIYFVRFNRFNFKENKHEFMGKKCGYCKKERFLRYDSNDLYAVLLKKIPFYCSKICLNKHYRKIRKEGIECQNQIIQEETQQEELTLNI